MSDAAITTIVTGLVTIVTLVCGVVTLWIKLKENTKITEMGAVAATRNAITAASVAETVSKKTDLLIEQINGKLEERITTIVKVHTEPIITLIHQHADQDDKNMTEIRQALGELRDRIPK